MTEPPGGSERRGGRRRLREPAPETPPHRNPEPRPAPGRPARSTQPSELPPRHHRRAQPPEEQPGFDGPPPRRRAVPPDTPAGPRPSGRRRRAEPEDYAPGDYGTPAEDHAPPADEPPVRRAPRSRYRDEPDGPPPPRPRRMADTPAQPPRRVPPPDRAAGPPERPVGPPDRPASPVDRPVGPPDRAAGPPDRPVGPPDRPSGPPDRAAGTPAEPPPRVPPEPPRRPRPVRDERPTDIIPFVPDEPEPPKRDSRPEPGEAPAEDEFFDEYGYDDEYDQEYEDEYEDGEYEDEEPEPKKRRGKRAFGWIAALAVLVALAGGAWYGYQALFGYEDFEGSGTGDVLVQVEDGDSTSAIGARLADAGVVASGRAFVKAGKDNQALAKIQHGYYVLKQRMSGASAVDQIVSPQARVGELELKPYTQFDDITQPDGKVTPGVFSLLSKASCANLNGKSTCISTDELRKTVENADLKALGVPDWAVAPASKAEHKDKRLEGLIAPGVYDVKPGSPALDIVTKLVKDSATAIAGAGLTAQHAGPGKTPYETLIIASIIEREAITSDFGKISRVIYNRLDKGMKLEMDSTINYPLDKPTLWTSDADRAKPGPYNSYLNTGLPPTPIAVSSKDAIQAALNPPPGDWLFFVKCEKNGQSCFAVTYEDHKKNKHDADARGVG
ncbi:endolytic transglycosylase MltG [Amycolatopsis samaneae]|uniref:Endolytic murein transglycosylase n=1 Tax=Amycolatopsis samaneae TaxID=664691 RepID=A0ABW5GBE4_9PSEU